MAKTLKERKRIEVPVDADTYLVWARSKAEFMLKFRVSGRWYYQWLVWSCRANKGKYLKAVATLYRILKKNHLVTDNLRRLAGASPKRRMA